jgi:hypothetical protein
MQNKFIPFVRDMALSLIMIIASTYWFYQSSPLHVMCELQNDETYSCIAQHELFGLSPIKAQADKVVSIEWELKCKNNNTGGCAFVSQFITTKGEKVKLSNFFTANQDKVEELVQSIDSLMKEKSPTIDYTGTQSMLLSGSLFFCLVPIALFVPFLRLIPSKKGEGARTLISWGKKEK